MLSWLLELGWKRFFVGVLGGGLGAAGLTLVSGLEWLAWVLGGLWLLASIGVGLWRLRVARLPLQLSQSAVQTIANGRVMFRVRAMLGVGRCLHRPRATVQWQPDDGSPSELATVGPGVSHLVGPWTVVAVDMLDVVKGPGTLRVTVEGIDNGVSVRCSKAWSGSDLTSRPFVPAVGLQRGRVVWDMWHWQELGTAELGSHTDRTSTDA